MGEARGEVVDREVKIFHETQMFDRGGQVVNWLVELRAKRDDGEGFRKGEDWLVEHGSTIQANQ